ncbi:MAG: RsmB/NOP family class I SAM-dependent RNA methyltransferase [Alphaproteobacteria bacterium]|nr:MAG: RsmB/NOP family class I SAM-dependent RNA methyltransferase [Alphaproteobacteria bacterium]
MQPAARLAAALELLEAVEAAMAARGAPADVLVGDYFRARRYAGSKDRRAVSQIVYDILRVRELYLWALGKVGQGVSARALLIAHLVHTDPAELDLFGADDRFGPAALDEAEGAMIEALQALVWAEAPNAAAANLPAWARTGFERRYPAGWADAAVALRGHAPLDVRLNPLKADPEKLTNKLKGDLEDFEKTKYSPFGFRSAKHVNLGGAASYKDGLIEVQDEAAQIASLLVEAMPGQQVIDLCAGAGGKSLLIAATMAGKGQLHAFDIAGKRLHELKARSQRAGAHNIQSHRLPVEGPARQDMLVEFVGKADRVVLDVPCTGSGTWRRSPDQRWRFDDDSLTALVQTQSGLLAEGASLVKVGGRLLYMTCSSLPAENEDVVSRFLATESAKSWTMVDYRAVWPRVLQGAAPKSLSLLDGALQLAPHVHQTDGFFVAILERTA